MDSQPRKEGGVRIVPQKGGFHKLSVQVSPSISSALNLKCPGDSLTGVTGKLLDTKPRRGPAR